MSAVEAGLITGRIIAIVFMLAIPVGMIFLQIYLSKREERWLGLILPIITVALSLIVVFGMAVFVNMSGTITLIEMIDGELVTTIIDEGGSREAMPGAVAGVIFTFVLMNIPTAVLLIIYKVVRGKQNRHREVEKMSVHDLG